MSNDERAANMLVKGWVWWIASGSSLGMGVALGNLLLVIMALFQAGFALVLWHVAATLRKEKKNAPPD